MTTVTKRNRIIKALRTFFLLMLAFSCTPEEGDDAIPEVPFPDIVLNLSLPENFGLRTVGNHKYVSGGVRGIIVYKRTESTWVAFERNCSFRPNDACATVEVDPTGFQMFDGCCGSYFNFSGDPTSGVAWRPLRQYRVSGSINQLVITDEIVNGI